MPAGHPDEARDGDNPPGPTRQVVDLPVGLDGATSATVSLPTQGDKVVVHALAGRSANPALLECLWVSRLLVALGDRDLTALPDADRVRVAERLYGPDVQVVVDTVGGLARQFGTGEERCPFCGTAARTTWPG